MFSEDSVNKIEEIYKGSYYQIILHFATNKIIKHLLLDEYPYVWVHNYWVDYHSEKWGKYLLPISENLDPLSVLAHHIRFDFIMTTDEFKKVLPSIRDGIKIVQLKKIPPYYLDLHRIDGKTRYDLLKKECDFLFELEIPFPTDYGTIISSSKEYLQSLLNNEEINWNDLP